MALAGDDGPRKVDRNRFTFAIDLRDQLAIDLPSSRHTMLDLAVTPEV
eukprot:COSAG02_NODE_2362_length_9062_cov_129.948789_5_plen_48_part_00